MKIYESAVDALGDPYQGRSVLFVPKKTILSDGTFNSYSLNHQRVSASETGYVFIIDKKDENNLYDYKIINGELHRK